MQSLPKETGVEQIAIQRAKNTEEQRRTRSSGRSSTSPSGERRSLKIAAVVLDADRTFVRLGYQ